MQRTHTHTHTHTQVHRCTQYGECERHKQQNRGLLWISKLCECVCVFFWGRILHAHWRIQLNRTTTLIYLGGRGWGKRRREEEREKNTVGGKKMKKRGVEECYSYITEGSKVLPFPLSLFLFLSVSVQLFCVNHNMGSSLTSINSHGWSHTPTISLRFAHTHWILIASAVPTLIHRW